MQPAAKFKRLLSLLPFALALVAALPFLSSLHGGFVNWDDPYMLLNNPHFRGLGWTNIQWMFTTFRFGGYFPLSWLSYAVDYSIWGMNPFGYKLTNLLLHLGSAVLVYHLCSDLLPAGRLRKAAPAAAAALLFAVHPLRVESVVWISERRDVLSGFFFLACLLAYVRGFEKSALAAFSLSLLSKGAGVGMPFVLWALDLYPFRRPWRESLVKKWPYFLLSLLAGLIALKAQGEGSRILTLEELGVGGRFAMAMYCFRFYLLKSLLPFDLNPLYARPDGLSPLEQPYLGAALFVFALSAFFVYFRRRLPSALAAWFCYLIMLAPLSGLFPNGPQIAADRYSYLACLGFPLALAGGVFSLAGARRKAVFLFLGAWIGGLGFLTWRQTAVWNDSLSLWRRIYAFNKEHTLAQTNMASTLYNEGVLAAEAGRLEEALAFYREAIAVYPAFWQAHQNSAVILLKAGRINEAREHLTIAASINEET